MKPIPPPFEEWTPEQQETYRLHLFRVWLMYCSVEHINKLAAESLNSECPNLEYAQWCQWEIDRRTLLRSAPFARSRCGPQELLRAATQ
jgi:hypothetical protein